MANRYWVGSYPSQFSVADKDVTPNGVYIKPDGTKMYVVGASNDSVYEYSLSSAWDITTASYVQTFSVASEETGPTCVFFKDDGTKMYVLGDINNSVFEYDLSTAWDISTASYLQSFSVATQETNPSGFFFKSDGTEMYVVGFGNDRVNQYSLSSAWNISTASYIRNFSVGTQETSPTGVSFKSDGTKMYIIGSTGDDVNEYNLSTAWNISTASYVQVFSVATQDSSPQGLFFKPDGLKMFMTGGNSDSVWSYDLSTAWDVSTIRVDTWNGSAGLKWSATSGGSGGASVPTTSDDVFFDSNSIGQVIIATGNTGAKSITCTGFAGLISGSINITVAGSVTLNSAMNFSYTGTISFTGTGTLTTAGKTLGGITVNGSGITTTQGDALNIGGSNPLIITAGSFDTAGYSLSASYVIINATTTDALKLNNSTVNLSRARTVGSAFSLNTASPQNAFNAGTSLINFTAASVRIARTSIARDVGCVFYNVAFTSEITNSGIGYSIEIYDGNTFNNLSVNAPDSGSIYRNIIFSRNQTINGTLQSTNTNGIRRILLSSEVLLTTRTLSIASAPTATDFDFQDIAITGAAAPISLTRAGDLGGNSGITFSSKTVYRVGTDTTWMGSSSWAVTSGGTGDNNNFPLAQDTAVINNDTTGTSIVFSGMAQFFPISGLNCSTRTTSFDLDHSATTYRYGSCIFGSGITPFNTGVQRFLGRVTMTFTSAGKTITFPVVVDAPSGTFQLGDAFNSNSNITNSNGTVDANNYNLTCSTFASNTGSSRTINMGSGLWTLTGEGAVWELNGTFTLNKGSADILLSSTGTTARTFAGGGKSYNKLTIGGSTGTSTLTITGSNTFTELESIKTVAHTITFTSGTTTTLTTWSVNGSSGNVVTINSSSAGSRATLSKSSGTVTVSYLSIKDSLATGGAVWDASNGTNTDAGNNSGWTFGASNNIGNFFLFF